MSDDDEHWVPVEDDFEHVCEETCWCKPDLVAYANGVGIYQHNAHDGRPMLGQTHKLH